MQQEGDTTAHDRRDSSVAVVQLPLHTACVVAVFATLGVATRNSTTTTATATATATAIFVFTIC